MLTDAGSIPAVSTKLQTGLDLSRPVYTLPNQTLTSNERSPSSVSDGLKRSPFRHHFDTNWALDVTDQFGTHECKPFRKEIFNTFRPLSNSLAKEYLDLAREKDYVEANRRLLQRRSQLQINDLNLTAPEDELKNFAIKKASACQRCISDVQPDIAHISCIKLAESYGLQVSDKMRKEIKPALARLSDSDWWKRATRKLCSRILSEIERDIGIINNQKKPYSSDRSVQKRRVEKLTQQKFLEETFFQNHKGEKFSLAELSSKSVSNPAIRRAELMTRISGFEKVAKTCGHSCQFLTLTTPSRMHKCLSKNGKPNPKFDHTTPNQAHNYLCRVWARIRAALARQNICPYGFRVAEPHHDGTPHWHLMLFVHPKHVQSLNEVMRKYALAEDGEEKGASKYRFKSLDIDMEAGSAAGYICKYISKSIDGEFIDNDLLGNPAKESAERIEAWSRNHNIRQFQQIGGPSVTVWRELRRMKDPLDDKDAEVARSAADSGDWAAYVFAMGGVEFSPKTRPIESFRDYLKAIDLDTGELLSFTHSKYGDLKEKPLRGLLIHGVPIITRTMVWAQGRRLVPIDTDEFQRCLNRSNSKYVNKGTSNCLSALPWTCVNNCTHTNSLSIQ